MTESRGGRGGDKEVEGEDIEEVRGGVREYRSDVSGKLQQKHKQNGVNKIMYTILNDQTKM